MRFVRAHVDGVLKSFAALNHKGVAGGHALRGSQDLKNLGARPANHWEAFAKDGGQVAQVLLLDLAKLVGLQLEGDAEVGNLRGRQRCLRAVQLG